MIWGQGAGWQSSHWHAALWFGPAVGAEAAFQPERSAGGGGGSGQLSLSEYLERFGPTIQRPPARALAKLDPPTGEGDEPLMMAAWVAWFD